MVLNQGGEKVFIKMDLEPLLSAIPNLNFRFGEVIKKFNFLRKSKKFCQKLRKKGKDTLLLILEDMLSQMMLLLQKLSIMNKLSEKL